MRHRSYIDIVGVILKAASESRGIGKNRLMFKTFLGYAQLKEYLPALTEKRLLRYDRDAQTFKTTRKGHRFLNIYNQLYETMRSISSPIQHQQQVRMQLG
jgi:predicted transcriptional regulator